MTDNYIYVIIALLPLSACMLVFQVNPYHALVIRGILGAVAALVYAVLGAADVALTEALVGTMLAITLYAVAARSSLTMRLGVLQNEEIELDSDSIADGKAKQHFVQLKDDLKTILSKHYMRLELVPYTDRQTLQQALMDKEVHATCIRDERSPQDNQKQLGYEFSTQPYHTQTRVQRLYEIMQTELASPAVTTLTYVKAPEIAEHYK
ncbi:MAG: DUF4040 domain-containing protein [Symploca sp. SIO3C6]|uniref:DUF4040 domain-containing protein n=1 Tax=Symploca sp. SIO1C4 TaxID=2607765 RepID=A0A6B3NFH3_9CYAN|nr:DUF4040 domain-containing protein [Symploca sp. SIO3C6]NER30383.1 DUF4040 domain-containing protein [Symploca sp. SIO1C4]NET04939.1 DUF4040 domain-containing protein [Symploca sp. SIO2B6]